MFYGLLPSLARLYFICGTNFLEAGLANGVTGMVGLGRTGASLPAQLSSYFRFEKKFAVCLSSSTKSSGVVLFGNGPYSLLPNVDVSSSLTYVHSPHHKLKVVLLAMLPLSTSLELNQLRLMTNVSSSTRHCCPSMRKGMVGQPSARPILTLSWKVHFIMPSYQRL